MPDRETEAVTGKPPDAVPGNGEMEQRGRTARRVLLATVVVIVLVLPWLPLPAYNYTLQISMMGLMWVAMGSSWNIIGGYTGYISLGHNAFLGIGAYAAGIGLVYLGISPLISAPIAGLIAAVAGLAVGLITLRAKGPTFIIATIAMIFVVRTLIDNWGLVGAASGMTLPLPNFPVRWNKVPFYYGMAATAFGAIYLAYRVAHSKFGLGLRALSQDEVKAEVAGISTRWYKVIAVALSAFFIGTAGAIWGYQLSYLRPAIFFNISVATQMVVATIIGGRGTVAGPIVGALLVVGVNEVTRVQFGGSQLNIVINGIILLAVLVFFPRGMVGSLKEAGRLPRCLDWD